MNKHAKKLGVWAGIISGAAAFGCMVGMLTTYLSMSMDSLDQPLHSYYNLNDPLGKRFYQLSQSHSRDDHKFLIVPSAIGEDALKGMLSSDGWDIADNRWVKPSESRQLMDEKYGNRKGGSSSSGSIGNGTFCNISILSLNQASSYHRLFNGDKGASPYALFSHELGHCLHNLFDHHSNLTGADNALEDDLLSIVDLEFDSEAIQWTNLWDHDSFSEMHQRYLQEAFADVYAYTHMTYEKGYDAKQIHDMFAKDRVSAFKYPGRAVYFTSPFVSRAHDNRDKIASFASSAQFADYIIRDAPYSDPKFFSAIFVAHLVMSGKIDMEEVKNKRRGNSAIQVVNHYR